ncbi:TetR/AcrR family transcriptional regulator [Nocardioides KLBMP 9356]|uniref:TetR/AcrR family transcriptional regulator n=1 Tax=Nocardioides potassii TaxID=2911371 RepID=A0ABS9H8R9_9ACTN|nr:TetR/AcrR family transcriptional regulator [Nocardioides potassii]MCF6376662.1 TetR/AcrR family transcriptional regulator [Nocardioides potassii]
MPTSTWERLPQARRAAVISAAEAEFAEHGFSGGSLNVIAREAGVAKGSLFQYFHDKVDLYSYLSERASTRIRGDMEPVIASLPWQTDFFGAFEDLTVAWVAYFRSHPLELAMTVAVNLEPDRSARTAVRRVANEHYLSVLEPLLRTAKDSGALRPDADIEAFLSLLLVLLPHVAVAPSSPGLDPVLGLSSPDHDDQVAAAKRLVAVLRAAFEPAPVGVA